MPRVIINKATGRIGEFQSDATEGTLLKNISDNGGDPNDFEERVVTREEYSGLFANDSTRSIDREIEVEAKLIEDKTANIQQDRDRKDAVRLLKLEGKNFIYYDNNGDRK